jgi:hypothetical protein
MMAPSHTHKFLSALLAPLVKRSDEISARIEQLITDGDLGAPERYQLQAERDRIDLQLNQLLGDEGTKMSPRTSIWRARAVIAETRDDTASA